RQDLIAAIAGQYAELAGRWLHLRVTTRPYPIRMWAEAHVHNAVNRLPHLHHFPWRFSGQRRPLRRRAEHGRDR
ncbi:MAG: hypothetical protein GEV28_40995, partial [Actinophytocola sp.]|uniref:hypothetical protein n=1 Tax=Actinophytocola sp. TaxID=1872138 RepID=UPI001328AF0F